ncbi:MAG: AMP-dependent synthetase [Candidatus Tectimicrobiota bacterium]|nr:MAG: AMP-dependent synthetase [Candidatus Tectomicrobia bacterium]
MTWQSLPQMFFTRAAPRGARPAQLVKRHGQWQAISWQALQERVRALARGLIALGLQPGERVALLADSCAEWVQCDLAILTAAGITVPVYPSLTSAQVAYILNDAEVTLAFVDTPQQLAKLHQVRAQVPTLRQAILLHEAPTADAWVLTLEQLGAHGTPDLEPELEARLRGLSPETEATYVYTSGTTGPPKGVVQTHGNHLFMVESCAQIMDAQEGDVNLLFLPLAHSFARLEAFLGLYVGLTTAFAESIEALPQNLREVRPMLMFAVPRVYEKMYARVQAAAASGSPLKKALFQWCVGIGRRVSRRQQQRQPVPLWLGAAYRLAHLLVFRKLHQAVGGRLRYFVSGGAPLAKEIAEFFHAAGILILEGYGLTESCPALTVNRLDRYKFGTVGLPLPGVEIRLAPDGEILARGPNVAKGYYKRPQETAAVFREDGWLATGDIGELDAEGFLRITDRKKDIIVTSGGKNIAPQNIENLLKTDRYISQAMVYGDGRKYLTAILTLDQEEVANYARQHGIPASSPEALATHPAIYQLIAQRVAAINAQLASYETIKKFLIAPEDFTQESGELTPTLKVRRQVILQKYQAQLERLYEED